MNKVPGLLCVVGLASLSGCTGDDAVSSLIVTSAEAEGENCPIGGLKIVVGLDNNGNGVLESTEVEETNYVCSGAGGTNGADGTDGLQSLVSTSDEAPSANCPVGGTRIDYGIDDNGDGVLDTEEIDGTSYSCDGAGPERVISFDPIPASFDCPAGGQTINIGVDDNLNGTLEVGEIDNSIDLCDNTCVTAPFTITKSFTNLGSFATSLLDQDEVSITGTPRDVNVLNLNGLGVVGGISSNLVDTFESLTFTFLRPALSVSYDVTASSNLDGNALGGEATVEAFGIDGSSLGSVSVSGSGTIQVSSQFADVPITSFRVMAASDGHRVGSLNITTCE